MINYLRMPAPLLVLGALYGVVAACYLISLWREGYWQGMLTGLRRAILVKPWRLILLVVVLLGLIEVADKPITRLCQLYYNQDFYTAVDLICSMGEGWFVGGVIFTLMLIFEHLGKHQLALVLRVSFMASIYAGLANGILKFLFNRQRPSMGLEPLNFFHFFITPSRNYSDLFYAYNSMPSGHTVTVFAALTPLILFAKTKTAKCLLALLGAAEAFARIYTINHWLSDIYVSMLLGLTIGSVCYKLNQLRLVGSNASQ